MKNFEAPFQIGSSYELPDGIYAVKGRMMLHAKDPEDGQYYAWEEYLAISPKGEQVWLTYEQYEREYAINEEIDITEQPDQAQLVLGNTVTLTTEDGPIAVRISESSAGEVLAVEGENPWNVQVGSMVPYMDGSGGGTKYGLEIYNGSVELYEMKPLSSKDVSKAVVKTHGKDAKKVMSRNGNKTGNFLIIAVVSLLAGVPMIGSLLGGNASGRRDCQAGDINQAQPVEWTSSSQQQSEIDSGSVCRDSTTGRYYRSRIFVGGSSTSGK